jgi:hypothetical protein
MDRGMRGIMGTREVVMGNFIHETWSLPSIWRSVCRDASSDSMLRSRPPFLRLRRLLRCFQLFSLCFVFGKRRKPSILAWSRKHGSAARPPKENPHENNTHNAANRTEFTCILSRFVVRPGDTQDCAGLLYLAQGLHVCVNALFHGNPFVRFDSSRKD